MSLAECQSEKYSQLIRQSETTSFSPKAVIKTELPRLLARKIPQQWMTVLQRQEMIMVSAVRRHKDGKRTAITTFPLFHVFTCFYYPQRVEVVLKNNSEIHFLPIQL